MLFYANILSEKSVKILIDWYTLYNNPLITNAERVDRIKEAKSEAEALIAAYRAEMEANYQKKMNVVRENVLLFW